MPSNGIPQAVDEQTLQRVIERDSLAAVCCLAAAERAVAEGRLNVAKVLRAASLSARQRALVLARASYAGISAAEAVAVQLEDDARTVGELTSLLPDASGAEREAMRVALAGATSVEAVLRKTVDALETDRDVAESVVAQFVFACAECGWMSEASRPEVCPACGSIAGDFELYAPFFSANNDRIARRQPADIVAQLRGDAAAAREAIAGVDDALLRRSVGQGEWCIKETLGHMVDIAELFCRRARPVLEPGAEDAPETVLLPWKLLDGQDYPSQPADAIAGRYERAIDESLALIARAGDGDWRKRSTLARGAVTLIDLASWLANHNVAHLEQVRAMRTRWEQDHG